MDALKNRLVEDAAKWYKMYSIWVFAFIAVLPDIWNLVVESGLLQDTEVGQKLNATIKLVSLLGAVMRLVKQAKLTLPPPAS